MQDEVKVPLTCFPKRIMNTLCILVSPTSLIAVLFIRMEEVFREERNNDGLRGRTPILVGNLRVKAPP